MLLEIDDRKGITELLKEKLYTAQIKRSVKFKPTFDQLEYDILHREGVRSFQGLWDMVEKFCEHEKAKSSRQDFSLFGPSARDRSSGYAAPFKGDGKGKTK